MFRFVGMKENIRDIFQMFALLLAPIILAILWAKASLLIDSYEYNGGVCRDCGSSYEISSIVRSSSEDLYEYKCSLCGKTIVLTHPYNLEDNE